MSHLPEITLFCYPLIVLHLVREIYDRNLLTAARITRVVALYSLWLYD